MTLEQLRESVRIYRERAINTHLPVNIDLLDRLLAVAEAAKKVVKDLDLEYEDCNGTIDDLRSVLEALENEP